MRPAPDHSQTVTLVDQLFNRDTLQGSAVFIDKAEHFADCLIAVAVVVG